MIIYYGLILLLLLAAAFDVMKLRIPNAICTLIAALFVVSILFGGERLDLAEHLGAFALVLAVGVGLFVAGIMGGGDVKLLAATSLWVGFDLLLEQLVYIALLGLIVLLCLFAARYLANMVVGRMRIWRRDALPLSLLPGEGVPYGVAISAATILLTGSMSPALWPI